MFRPVILLPLLVVLLMAGVHGWAAAQGVTDLQGRWRNTEREVIVELAESPDRSWRGLIVSAPDPLEVGRPLLDSLVASSEGPQWRGWLRRPGSSDRMRATLTVTSDSTFEVTVKKLVMRKTLKFVKVRDH